MSSIAACYCRARIDTILRDNKLGLKLISMTLDFNNVHSVKRSVVLYTERYFIYL